MLSDVLNEKKISTNQLAILTGISKRTLDHYRDMSRKISLENGLKISDALGIDPHELLR